MRRLSACLALVFALAVTVAPIAAEARIGFGSSFGSRGGRTWSAPSGTGTAPGGGVPMQRSTTVPGAGYNGTGSYNSGYGGFGYGRSGLGTGLMGGLLGFGLGSMLFGHRGFGYGGGFGGGFGILGFLLRIFIVAFVVRWLVRRFLGPRRGMARPGMVAPGLFGGMFAPRMAAAGPAYAAPMSAPMAGPPVAIQPSDYNAFEAILRNIQAAWSRADINTIRGMATPEMVSYFAEQLADYASRGQRNVVSDVRLQKGDLSEAWAEGNRTYATVAMQFSMTDVTYDSAGRVVDGSPNEHVTATEYWTFLRATGGLWLLSAIQQTR